VLELELGLVLVLASLLISLLISLRCSCRGEYFRPERQEEIYSRGDDGRQELLPPHSRSSGQHLQC
jgi:hypothetical protein